LLAKACPHDTNYITIRLNPNAGIYIELNSKIPEKQAVTPVKMSFSEEAWFGPNTPEAYETLLFNVIEGDSTAFVRNDEIENAWKIVDPINKKRPKLHIYKAGSEGPKALETWNKKHKLEWKT